MAEKEVTVFIVDVGQSMAERRHGRSQTDLDWALTYVWDRITSTMALGRLTTFQAVVGLKTDDTSNELSDDPSFHRISVFQDLEQILIGQVNTLRDRLVPSNTDQGDAISAIVVAIQMIAQKCKRLKYIRRIILVTNGRGELDPDQVSEISAKIKEEGIELFVLGVDFDDAEYGFQEPDKDPSKAKNERILASLVESCNGVIGTLAQAVDELGMPRLKSTKPTASYKNNGLSLGDAEKYSGAFKIEVERYPRVMIRKPPTASSFVDRPPPPQAMNGANGRSGPSADPDAMDQDGGPGAPDGLTGVKTEKHYEILDGPRKGEKVPQSQLEKGYEYGRTAVHISDSDRSLLDLDSKASLQVIGFVEWGKFDRYMAMSRTNIIIGAQHSSRDIMALSSLIHALRELESFAVARFVPKDGKAPLILLLAPSIEPDYECLIDVELPFAEDVRPYRFPPLDKVVTVSGKVLTEHRNLPSEGLKRAMDEYVDRMDLSDLGPDEDGCVDPFRRRSHVDTEQQPHRVRSYDRHLLPHRAPHRPGHPLARRAPA